MKIFPVAYNVETKNNRQFSQAQLCNINFCSKVPDLNNFYKALNNRNHILYNENKSVSKIIKDIFLRIKKYFSKEIPSSKYAYLDHDHKWTSRELKSVEGLQHGLKIFEGMNIKQVYFILNAIKQKGLNMPIVRGCYHNCAHCFVGAKAPVERMSYEDFHNFVSELSTMYKRFGIDPKSRSSHIISLFHDSDGSELYLLDKNNNVHEFPELVHEIAEKLKTPSFIDTAGWNLQSEKAQKRMERLVSYYVSHPMVFEKEIKVINLSLNPFHSLRVTALNQLKKGNIDNYNKLYNIYLDMVANTLNTFSPLLKSEKLYFLCRAYADDMNAVDLNGFRISDMEKIKEDVILRFKNKYPQVIEKSPDILDILDKKIVIRERVGRSGRNNKLSKYSINEMYQGPPKKNIPNKKFIKDLIDNPKNRAFIDLNGDFYIINDFVSYKTNLKFNFNNESLKKEMLPAVHSQIIMI